LTRLANAANNLPTDMKNLLVTKNAQMIDHVATGAAVALLRKKAKLTQAELARRIGVDPSVMNGLERGHRYDWNETLAAKVAKALKK